jgi:predicted nucleic acid-binding Zn ribbon protein
MEDTMKDNYGKSGQEVDIMEECRILEERKKKRRKKMGILYVVFLILAIVVNVGTGIYFQSKAQGIELEQEQEYSEKQNNLLERLNVKQH